MTFLTVTRYCIIKTMKLWVKCAKHKPIINISVNSFQLLFLSQSANSSYVDISGFGIKFWKLSKCSISDISGFDQIYWKLFVSLQKPNTLSTKASHLQNVTLQWVTRYYFSFFAFVKLSSISWFSCLFWKKCVPVIRKTNSSVMYNNKRHNM